MDRENCRRQLSRSYYVNNIVILPQHQEHFLRLLSVLPCLGVGVEEDVHMISFDTASAVFCGVDNSADHDLTSIRNNARVYGNGVAGLCDGTGTGAASPAFGTLFARAIAGGVEETKGF